MRKPVACWQRGTAICRIRTSRCGPRDFNISAGLLFAFVGWERRNAGVVRMLNDLGTRRACPSQSERDQTRRQGREAAELSDRDSWPLALPC